MKAALKSLHALSRGFIYRDAHYLVAQMTLDPKRAAHWVPRPLRLAGRTATVFLAWFPHTSFGSVYREAGIFLPVRHRRQRAIHCPWILVDDDVALIVGRELLGYPKKLGDIEWRHRGDSIGGLARRRGAELLSMNGTLGAVISAPPPIIGQRHRNVRASLGVALPWVLAFTPREEIIEVRAVSLTVRVGNSERDPLGDLGLGTVTDARLHRVNIGAERPPIPIAVASPASYLRSVALRVR